MSPAARWPRARPSARLGPLAGLLNASHWTLLVAMIALLLQLGGDSSFGSAHVDAPEIEDCDCGSTQWEGHDSDRFEDGVSSETTLEPAAAIASRIVREPAAALHLQPGYPASLERPPDAVA